ncbi:hypothetical protein VUR80DRAFT_3757 [Thermomyces stellatus]
MVRRPVRWAAHRAREPVRLHYAYFTTLALVASLLFYVCGLGARPLDEHGTERKGVGYVDALFLVVSALTNTGLTTVPLSRVSAVQQGLLCTLMILGSAIWVSFWMLVFRRGKEGAPSLERGYSATWGKEKVDPELPVETEAVAIKSGVSVFDGSVTHHAGPHPGNELAPRRSSHPAAPDAPHPEEGYATTLLARLVPVYALLWLSVAACIHAASVAAHLPDTHEAHPHWTAVFLATSAFTNCGMTLTDDNLEPFRHSYVVLALTASLILAGNTAFPAFLRLMVFCARGLAPRRMLGRQKSALSFVLRFPRRVYTHLFPARQTWWLVVMLAATTGVDWVAFEVMSVGNPALERIPLGPRVLDGLFQAISVRGAGFHVVPVSELYLGLRLLYMVMMYISAFPIVIAMRHASAASPPRDDPEIGLPAGKTHALSRLKRLLSPGEDSGALARQIRAQVLHDALLLPLATALIAFLERPAAAAGRPTIFNAGALSQKDAPGLSIFDVAFEVVSAYGCVGMSVGSFSRPASLSSDFGAWSKLLLVGIMLKGRHRGLGVILGGG